MRPLQKNITDEDMKPHSTSKVKLFLIMLSYLLVQTHVAQAMQTYAYADHFDSESLKEQNDLEK